MNKQARRNRHITQVGAMDAFLIEPNDPERTRIHKAHLALNSLLNQADIELVNRQMVEAGTISAQRKVLNAWFDWLETSQKLEMMKENGSGTQAYWFTFFALESKVLNRREWAESL